MVEQLNKIKLEDKYNPDYGLEYMLYLKLNELHRINIKMQQDLDKDFLYDFWGDTEETDI